VSVLHDAGITDGLPVVPPTAERVEEFLRAAPACRSRVGPIALSFEPPSIWDLAANAVMAGCEPRWFPIVMAALEALTQPAFNLLGVQSTTSGVAPFLIAAGPAASAAGMHSGSNAMAGTARANMSIGRAVRLNLQNLGNVMAGVPNPATVGHPGKTSWCVAEATDDNPWPPLHESIAPEVPSAVTVVAGVGSLEIIFTGTTVDDDVDNLAITCACMQRAGRVDRVLGVGHRAIVALLPPETANRFDAAGLDRAALQRELAERATLPGTDTPAGRPEDFLIAVCGGTGIKGAVIPTWGAGAAVTAAIDAGA
jgi:hypothetical protein